VSKDYYLWRPRYARPAGSNPDERLRDCQVTQAEARDIAAREVAAAEAIRAAGPAHPDYADLCIYELHDILVSVTATSAKFWCATDMLTGRSEALPIQTGHKARLNRGEYVCVGLLAPETPQTIEGRLYRMRREVDTDVESQRRQILGTIGALQDRLAELATTIADGRSPSALGIVQGLGATLDTACARLATLRVELRLVESVITGKSLGPLGGRG